MERKGGGDVINYNVITVHNPPIVYFLLLSGNHNPCQKRFYEIIYTTGDQSETHCRPTCRIGDS